MARPEQPVSTTNEGLRELAEWLRESRRAAGVTHREMAEATGHTVSASTFSRATSGDRIPRLQVVEEYARACQASVRLARQYWQAARYVEHQRTHLPAKTTEPDQVYTPAHLNEALKHLYYRAGAMPVLEMERRAGAHGQLPHSTVSRVLADKAMFDYAQFLTFLRICDVTNGVEWERWRSAWQRARHHRDVEHMSGRIAWEHQASKHESRSTRKEESRNDEAESGFHRGPIFQVHHPYVALARPRNKAASGPRWRSRPGSGS
ncbi:helix-turn-helix domain-containing protein [Streptomyces flavofungini]|uniref:helix-turn-helix domain-containing protein n=1 Tax=Streptomyces flavofungini TaxID=68200 RepID=UPI0034DFD943